MDKQIKLLNKDYLSTRIRELKEIKRKELTFEIEESDRAFSKSLYVCFYTTDSSGKPFKTHTLRISDHSSPNCIHTQFIIEPNEDLTKKKKAQFMKILESCVRKGQTRFFYKEMEKITKKVEEEQGEE